MKSIRTNAECIGSVSAIRHGSIFADISFVAVGDLCQIVTRSGNVVDGQIVTVDGPCAAIIPLNPDNDVTVGCLVRADSQKFSVSIGNHLLGKVVDCLARPVGSQLVSTPSTSNSKPDYKFSSFQSRHPHTQKMELFGRSIRPLERQRLNKRFTTSISTIDSLCSVAVGQRVAIMASAGTGKSTLLGMIARNASADVVVVALVGERGREVRDFLEDCIGQNGMPRTVTVVSTSDDPPLARQLAAQTATTIAEFFRDQGLSVLLIVDSLTRVARAMRETGLVTGELPVRHGYPNSVFTSLPKLLERAGPGRTGWITGIYTLLTNAENDIDPLSEEVKSLLDGHVVLNEAMIQLGVRPAIDPLKSISRLTSRINSREHEQDSATVKRVLSRAAEIRQLQQVGVELTPELVRVLAVEREIFNFLNQAQDATRSLEHSLQTLHELASKAGPDIVRLG